MRTCMIVIALLAGLAAAEKYYLVTSGDQNSIRKYALDGAYLGDLVSDDSGFLNSPQYMAIDPNGDLLVANFNRPEVHVFDLQTGEHLRQFDLTQNVGGLAFLGYAPNGELWISAINSNRTLRYDGTTEAYLGDAFAPGDVVAPHGVHWRDDGSFLVSANGARIAEFAAVGADPEDFAAGTGLNRPLNIFPSPDGNQLFVSNFNARVSRFDHDGGYIGPLTDDIEPIRADGLTLTPEGNLLVVFWGTHEIREYDPQTGDLIGVFASRTIDGLTRPNDILLVPTPATFAVLAAASVIACGRRRRSSI